MSNGLWVGAVSAHSPLTGAAEALALDAAGKPLLALQQVVVEERVVGDGEGDFVLR